VDDGGGAGPSMPNDAHACGGSCASSQGVAPGAAFAAGARPPARVSPQTPDLEGMRHCAGTTTSGCRRPAGGCRPTRTAGGACARTAWLLAQHLRTRVRRARRRKARHIDSRCAGDATWRRAAGRWHWRRSPHCGPEPSRTRPTLWATRGRSGLTDARAMTLGNDEPRRAAQRQLLLTDGDCAMGTGGGRTP